MKCTYCGGKLIRRGKAGKVKFNGKTKFQCKKCGKYKHLQSRHPRSARILLMDIETLYMEIKGIWDLKHNDYIQPEKIVKDWSILCYAAKWLFDADVMGETVKPQEAINRDEASIIEGIWKLLDRADIVITQNGVNFDIPRLNSKFIKHGLPPPAAYQVIDTISPAVKKRFYSPSYKLDYLVKRYMGIEGKIHMTMEDWDACAEGSKQALDKMLFYCKRDVAPLLEDWYLYILPWIPNHPNLGLYTDHDGDVCPRCESQNISWNTKPYATPQGVWESFRCNTCGATGRGTQKKIHEVKSVSVKPT